MKLFLILLFVALAHVHHGSHKHDHSHSDGHKHPSHSHSDKLEKHDHNDHLHSENHDAIEEKLLISENSSFRAFFINVNSLVKESGPIVSTVFSSIFTTSASVLIFLFIWVIKKNNLLTLDVLNTLMSFSCGALLGDIFLHLMPSIPSSRNSSLLILTGILGFYVLDRVLSHSHSESHEHAEEKEEKKEAKKENQKKKPKKHAKSNNDQSQHNEKIHEHKHSESALLLFLADFLHNVTDGMAIGASYSIGSTLGITTTIAIFLHEIAHELGDFIAFLKFGMSLQNSLYMNLTTGIGSLIGGISVILLGNNETLQTFVLPIVVGNFFYISLVSMLANMKTQNKKNIVWEVLFFSIGIGLMILIEELE